MLLLLLPRLLTVILRLINLNFLLILVFVGIFWFLAASGFDSFCRSDNQLGTDMVGEILLFKFEAFVFGFLGATRTLTRALRMERVPSYLSSLVAGVTLCLPLGSHLN